MLGGAGWGRMGRVIPSDNGPPRGPGGQDRLRAGLRSAFRWRGDRTDEHQLADPSGWWADPGVLAGLGPGLAALFPDEQPTVIVGPQSRGMLVGALVAAQLQLGLVELRKDPTPAADSDRWIIAHTPPDYRDRTLRVGARRDLLLAGQRALLVDDWIETGGQAIAARQIVERAGAAWCGVAVIVDALDDSRLRRDLRVRSLLNVRDLDG